MEGENRIILSHEICFSWPRPLLVIAFEVRHFPHVEMSHHTQFEANMTLSGANADVRVMAKPSEQKTILADLYNAIVNGASAKNTDVAKAVKQLNKAGNKAVVVTGIQDKNAQ